MAKEKFQLGRIVATPGALAALEASGKAPVGYLARHFAGDWGDVNEHDRRENELSLRRLADSVQLHVVERHESLAHHGGRPKQHNDSSSGGVFK